MAHRIIRPLRRDEFAALMRLEEEVFGTAGEDDAFEATQAVDGGNVVFPPFDREAGRAAIEAAVAAVVAQGPPRSWWAAITPSRSPPSARRRARTARRRDPPGRGGRVSAALGRTDRTK